LKAFLEETGHPVVERWKAIPVEVAPEAEEVEVAAAPPEVPIPGIPIAAGGFQIILKDAKIYAKKVIIRRVEK
jgi:acetyl-CoA decarbonylase/synthase complex subunit beta